MNQVKSERTGWRDENISRRHRLWGVACSAFDIDFLLLECDRCEPVAIIEYKAEYAKTQTFKMPQYRALKALGDRAQLPVFSARYKMDFSGFTVTACNGLAQTYFKQKIMSELEWVTFLYHLRGFDSLPHDILNNINPKEPTNE